MDGLPARWIVPNHQLHVAGKEGSLSTMVAVFCRFLSVVAGCHISSSLSYVEKWYKMAVRPLLMGVTLCTTLACTTPNANLPKILPTYTSHREIPQVYVEPPEGALPYYMGHKHHQNAKVRRFFTVTLVFFVLWLHWK